MHKYSKAPLPFLGQKRNWLKLINTLDFTDKIVIDLFGGSGLLSHTIKQNNPTATVIWNDFDDYQSRLDQIKATELLRKSLLQFDTQLTKAQRIDVKTQQSIIDVIQASSSTDYITISSWLLFSGNYAHSFDELISKGWYFRVTKGELNCEGYLDDVKRVQTDFKALFNEYKNNDNVVFVADPPYIMTNQSGYAPGKNDEHFRLGDAIHLMRELKDQKALLFSSTKSETDDLLKALDIGITKRTPLITSSGAGKTYTDLLYQMNWVD